MSNKNKSIIPPELENWTGNFDELVSTSSELLSRLSPETSAPSGSVIRYYQQQGVVGRGTPKGRTREFSSKELEQVITAKQMAEQNIPLSLVKSALDNDGKTPAEKLVSQMMSSAGIVGKTPVRSTIPSQSGPNLSASASNPLLMNMAAAANPASPASQPAQYVTLPAGGTVRYELGSGVAVELSTHEKTENQAKALRLFAQQLIGGTKINPKTP